MVEVPVGELAKTLTRLEAGDPETVQRVLTMQAPSYSAHVVGITGSPGVGKSTLVNSLISGLREREQSVAVLAVDPSSPFSGGALLGDRIRMLESQAAAGVFIRSMASRGMLGGVASSTPLAMMYLAASGFDYVLVETVGVGQSELAISQLADTTIVVFAPGLGDGVQAMKAGLIEVADILVVNKADHAGAGQTESELAKMLSSAAPGSYDWLPPIHRTVAVRQEGLPDLLDSLRKHLVYLSSGGRRAINQKIRVEYMLIQLATERLRSVQAAADGPLLSDLVDQVLRGDLDLIVATDVLLSSVAQSHPS